MTVYHLLTIYVHCTSACGLFLLPTGLLPGSASYIYTIWGDRLKEYYRPGTRHHRERGKRAQRDSS